MKMNRARTIQAALAVVAVGGIAGVTPLLLSPATAQLDPVSADYAPQVEEWEKNPPRACVDIDRPSDARTPDEDAIVEEGSATSKGRGPDGCEWLAEMPSDAQDLREQGYTPLVNRWVVTLLTKNPTGGLDPVAPVSEVASSLGITLPDAPGDGDVGFIAELTDEQLLAVRRSPLVASVRPEVRVKLSAAKKPAPAKPAPAKPAPPKPAPAKPAPPKPAPAKPAPPKPLPGLAVPPGAWGIDRIDQRGSVNGRFDIRGAGSGVDIYVVDTGVAAGNPRFGSRVKAFFSADGWAGAGTDCAGGHGHGTAVAGIAAGNDYGVARGATIQSVRVMCSGGDEGSILRGLRRIASSGRPGVVNMSLSGPPNVLVDDAVANLVQAGFFVVAAASNEDTNACAISPARVESAFTVSSIDIRDGQPGSRGHGTCIDILAPGENLTSLSKTGGLAGGLSGTSLAVPHVSGGAAVIWGRGEASSPDAIARQLVKLSTKGSVFPLHHATPSRVLYID